MTNWYLIRGGKMVTRYGDQPPATHTDPDTAIVTDLAGLSSGDLAALGWLAGAPTDPLAFDAATEKSYIQPLVPDGLDKFAKAWAAGPRDKIEVPKVVEQWIVEPLSPDDIAAIKNQQFQQVRWARGHELLRTDVLMLADSPVVADPVQFSVWKAYRQALRDLPLTSDDPLAVKWPTAPDGKGPQLLS